jgi:hypothetical protein
LGPVEIKHIKQTSLLEKMRENYLSSEDALERLVADYPEKPVKRGLTSIALSLGLATVSVGSGVLTYNRVMANIQDATNDITQYMDALLYAAGGGVLTILAGGFSLFSLMGGVTTLLKGVQKPKEVSYQTDVEDSGVGHITLRPSWYDRESRVITPIDDNEALQSLELEGAAFANGIIVDKVAYRQGYKVGNRVRSRDISYDDLPLENGVGVLHAHFPDGSPVIAKTKEMELIKKLRDFESGNHIYIQGVVYKPINGKSKNEKRIRIKRVGPAYTNT